MIGQCFAYLCQMQDIRLGTCIWLSQWDCRLMGRVQNRASSYRPKRRRRNYATCVRNQIEFWIAALIRLCRQVTNRHVVADRVSFIHRRSVTPELNAFFGCEVRFDANADEAVFSASSLNVPIVGADPYLNQVLVKYCEEALAHRRPARNALGPRVENAMATLLPHGKAQASEIARRLGMSKRTLARRLASEGLTFATVLRHLRSDLAKRHLADRDLSVSKIAWLLGYRDVSTFTNAFKRWTGKPPRAIRAAHLQRASGM